jgi:antitoxin component YwqK of YwqJK toxin-antitoxin module
MSGQLQDSAWYFHPSGKLNRKGIYESSRYANRWIYYFENGVVERIVNYQNGQPNGVTKVYNDKAFLIQEGAYGNGLEEGVWKFYNPEGVLEYSGQYESGKPVGVWYEFANGKKKVYKRY